MRRSLRRSRKSTSRSRTRRLTKDACEKHLKRKIGKNMSEYKSGRYSSRAQAVAVAYSQVKKKHPSCSRYFSRKSARKLRRSRRK